MQKQVIFLMLNLFSSTALIMSMHRFCQQNSATAIQCDHNGYISLL